MPGACVTVRKFAHLLFQDFVVGSTGSLNPLKLNTVMSDDGVGVLAGTEQVRVTVKIGSTTTELLPWKAMTGTPIGNATRYNQGLYRDGAFAIPALGTTEGEYHVEVRATDKLGRMTVQERCWNHRILAPKLRPTPGLEGGTKAIGFARAMFSTSLNPAAGETGDFAAKFLNANAAGAAVWSWRVKNYLGVPIYVTVNVARGVNANVKRRFVIRYALTNARSVADSCGTAQCFLEEARDDYRTPDNEAPVAHADVSFRARLFAMSGGETGAELLPCAGCANDDATQTYTFEIPARASAQGAPLAEYAVLTYLRPTLPVDAGTDTLMAPKDFAHQDSDPAPYSEFVLNGQTLTGKLVGAPSAEGCITQRFDPETQEWICTRVAKSQLYRAVLSVTYDLLKNVDTTYQSSAGPALPLTSSIVGSLVEDSPPWTSTEITTLP
jgi:hypothetical protein